MDKFKLVFLLVSLTGVLSALPVPGSSNVAKKKKHASNAIKTPPVRSGLYKSSDESLLEIGAVSNNSFVLVQAENEYAPECSLVKALPFKMVAPNIYTWTKDGCQMIFTRINNGNALVLTVNQLDKCFAQYDNDQPFTCFGNPMTERQGNYIAGRVYTLDTNPNDNIND